MIIINLISSLAILGMSIHEIHLIKENQRITNECFESIKQIVEAQTKFNNSATENIERHEEALKIIVNYIKAGETHDIGA